MEGIIFIGIQGSGKSTFYKEKFFNSHVRISNDLLKSRNREKLFIEACINTSQKFVVDNTNPTIEDRKKYIERLKETSYKIIGYYFESKIKECLERNNQRIGKELIPEQGVLGTYNRLALPNINEGFDILYYVLITGNNEFEIKEWNNEI